MSDRIECPKEDCSGGLDLVEVSTFYTPVIGLDERGELRLDHDNVAGPFLTCSEEDIVCDVCGEEWSAEELADALGGDQ